MAEPTSCCTLSGSHCARVDTMFNLPGVHVLDVAWRDRAGRVPPGLQLLVETDPAEMGCPGCGVIAIGHGVDTLGVDEHIWHPRPRPGKPPKELTGIVDLTRRNGRPKARLLDLVPGRSGKAYADWLNGHGEPFTTGIQVATLDPFRGYDNTIRDELDDATAILDAFHVIKLGVTAMEETRRRVQQEQLGHRGRKHDPLYRIRNVPRAGVGRLTPRQIDRLEHAWKPATRPTP